MAKRWYIVHAYSNFENKVAESIRDQAKQRGRSRCEVFDEQPHLVEHELRSTDRPIVGDFGPVIADVLGGGSGLDDGQAQQPLAVGAEAGKGGGHVLPLRCRRDGTVAVAIAVRTNAVPVPAAAATIRAPDS